MTDEVGSTLRALREKAGLSLGALARRVYFSKSYLSNVERGKRRATPAVIKAYREAFPAAWTALPLRADFDRTGAWGHNRDASLEQEEDDPTNRRDALKLGLTFAAGVMVPGTAPRLGAADVERLRANVRELYALGAQHGGGGIFDQALVQLREAQRLLSTAAYSSTVGRRLQVVVGELYEEAGWLAFDAGRQSVARRFFTEALALAELADSPQLKTLVLSSMAFQAVEYGEARESADLAQAAQRAGRPVATPRLSSLLAAREALAFARLGDEARCGAALTSAERLLSEGSDEEDPDWVASFWQPTTFSFDVARAHLALGHPGRAEQAARVALDGAHRDYPRNEALYLTSLAQALVAQGDVDEGAVVAQRALPRLDTLSSGRVRDRLRMLRAPLEAHVTIPRVRECVEQLARI